MQSVRVERFVHARPGVPWIIFQKYMIMSYEFVEIQVTAKSDQRTRVASVPVTAISITFKAVRA